MAVGGMRVQRGLTAERIEALAATMQHKEDVLQVNAGGAKCGIDYDPASPGKREALRRFLRFLSPHLNERLSLGPDMGTSFEEIEALAREEGIPSVKAAIGRAQGLSETEVLQRLTALDLHVGPLSLGKRRAGHGLAHAAFAASRAAGIADRPLTCALQGFGTLGRAAALTLHMAGVAVTTIADEGRCIEAEGGLPVPSMVATPAGTPLGELALEGVSVTRRESVLAAPVDVLLLAACEDSLGGVATSAIRAPVVVVGANEGLSPAEYEQLSARGTLAVPDTIAGSGGSAAMDALFAPGTCPAPTTVLQQVGLIVETLTKRVLAATPPRRSPLQAAREMAAATAIPPTARPYGLRLLRPAAEAPSLARPRATSPIRGEA